MQRAEITIPSHDITSLISEGNHLLNELKNSGDFFLELLMTISMDTPESRRIRDKINRHIDHLRSLHTQKEKQITDATSLINRIEKRIVRLIEKDKINTANNISEQQDRLEATRNNSENVRKHIAQLKSDYIEVNAKYQTMIRAPQGDQDYVLNLKQLKLNLSKLQGDLDNVKKEKADHDHLILELKQQLESPRLPAADKINKMPKYLKLQLQQCKILTKCNEEMRSELDRYAVVYEDITPEIADIPTNAARELLMEAKQHLIEVVEDDDDVSPEVKEIITESARELAVNPNNVEAKEQLVKIVNESKKCNMAERPVIVGSILAFLGVVAIAVTTALCLTGIGLPFAYVGIAIGCSLVAAGISMVASHHYQHTFFATRSNNQTGVVTARDNEEEVLGY